MNTRERNAKIRKLYREMNGEITNRDLCSIMHIEEIVIRLERMGTKHKANYCVINDLEKNVLAMSRGNAQRYCNKECDTCIKNWLGAPPNRHRK